MRIMDPWLFTALAGAYYEAALLYNFQMTYSPSFKLQIVSRSPCCGNYRQDSPQAFSMNRRKNSNFDSRTECKNSKHCPNHDTKSGSRTKEQNSKPKKCRQRGYYFMNGLGDRYSTSKSSKHKKPSEINRNFCNEYFVNWSKITAIDAVRRQTSLGHFHLPIELKKKRNLDTRSSESCVKGKVKCKLNSRRQNSKQRYLRQIEKLIHQQKTQSIKQQQELRKVSGKEAARLSKLHDIQNAEIRSKIENLRMQIQAHLNGRHRKTLQL